MDNVEYTNPFTAWLWESGAAFWLIAILLIVLAIAGSVVLFLEWKTKRNKK